MLLFRLQLLGTLKVPLSFRNISNNESDTALKISPPVGNPEVGIPDIYPPPPLLASITIASQFTAPGDALLVGWVRHCT